MSVIRHGSACGLNAQVAGRYVPPPILICGYSITGECTYSKVQYSPVTP